ncbi:MAG TPA: heparan-alpha-glucosaminide N-acetyltransferase domain-containing protein, partial [Gemmataceae bacterium]|nr:heparan-alpha-glucosaminide N-acetyltransferase domain-containing protein [Gemmataceae bacterium]
ITLRRGTFLFGLGMVFNVVVWLPEGTFNWDILTLIGASLLLLAFARHLPPGVLVLICVMVLLLSPILRVATDYDSVWNLGDYDYDFTFEDVVFGFFVNGYFPLFPWIVFPLMGFLVGDAVFPRPGRTEPRPWWVAGTGAALVFFALAGVLCQGMPGPIGKHYLTGITMYPASTCYVMGALGSGMIGLLLLRRWIDQNPRITGTGGILGFFRLFSTFSLTVYVLHHIAHVWPLWLYGQWMRNDPTYYWRTAVDTPTALLLALIFIVVCWFALLLLNRHPKYSRYALESLMRNTCDY